MDRPVICKQQTFCPFVKENTSMSLIHIKPIYEVNMNRKVFYQTSSEHLQTFKMENFAKMVKGVSQKVQSQMFDRCTSISIANCNSAKAFSYLFQLIKFPFFKLKLNSSCFRRKLLLWQYYSDCIIVQYYKNKICRPISST